MGPGSLPVGWASPSPARCGPAGLLLGPVAASLAVVVLTPPAAHSLGLPDLGWVPLVLLSPSLLFAVAKSAVVAVLAVASRLGVLLGYCPLLPGLPDAVVTAAAVVVPVPSCWLAGLVGCSVPYLGSVADPAYWRWLLLTCVLGAAACLHFVVPPLLLPAAAALGRPVVAAGVFPESGSPAELLPVLCGCGCCWCSDCDSAGCLRSALVFVPAFAAGGVAAVPQSAAGNLASLVTM